MKKRSTGPQPGSASPPPPKRKPPFKKHAKGGVISHGVVSELRSNHDTGHVRMSVRHGKAKRGGDGIFSTYPDESSFTIPPDAAKQFTMGQRVAVHVRPHGAKDAK
jgi:hypothetical protein